MTVTLETERLILRQPVPDDWEAFRAFFMSERADFVGGDGTEGRAWRILAIHLGQWQIHGFGSFVPTLRTDDTPVGVIGPWYPAGWPEKELGWSIFDGFEGQGYAYEAAAATRSYAYDVLGWDTAVSYVDPANSASARLAERLGCTRDGKAAYPGDDLLHVYRHPAPGARS